MAFSAKPSSTSAQQNDRRRGTGLRLLVDHVIRDKSIDRAESQAYAFFHILHLPMSIAFGFFKYS